MSTDPGQLKAELEKVEQAIRAQDALRGILADEQLEASLVALEEKRSAIQAVLVGPGAIAQDGSVAAGAGGVAVGRDVRGDVLAPGAKKEVHHHGPKEADPEALREAYLGRLFEATSHLSLAGVDPKAASRESEARLNLGAVYTALLTLSVEADERLARGAPVDREEQRRLSALTQLDRHRRLVLLGDPGGGKSTFVNFVALCLAGEALEREEANLALLTAPLPKEEEEDGEEAQPWSHGPLLPVRVILRDFAALGLPPAGQTATAEHLWQFLVDGLEAAALGDYAPHLRQELLEQGGLLLLDGLDEVPEANRRREQIKQAVQDFCRTFQRCRILITSRTYAYKEQDWQLPGFTDAVLAPFTPGQIRRFVDRWYAHIAPLRGMHPDDAQGRAELLKGAIFGSDRLHALAARPLLLTLMASLHAWRGGSLPQKREELYADTVDLLLDWWESQRVVRDAGGAVKVIQPSLAEWLKLDRDQVRELLNELAFEAHASQPELVGTADVPEEKLVRGLMRISQNPEVRPARLIEFLTRRAGLLLPRGVGVYTFPHRTFQEYLAACHLTDHDYPDLVADLARQDPDRWREVALLAGAKAARGTASAVWSLVDALCFQDPAPGTEQPDEDAWGALLSGQALVESGNLAQVSERNQKKVERVQMHLVRVLEDGKLPSVDRAAAGRALAKLGDPRPGVGLDPETGLPDIAWCGVPAGLSVMGSTDDSLVFVGKETPQHEVSLPLFRIGKVPVTNEQFAAFVGDGGYTERWRRCWTEAGWRWKEREQWLRPRDFGEPFGLPNHPAVGVSWYEVVAYCRWLTERLCQASLVPEGWLVRLPSEAEWEKAARGTDGQIYPWGDEFDAERCNVVDTGVGGTSAVGCFQGGASPYGVEDLSGNVWEWCGTKWRASYETPADESLAGDSPRVLRGGSVLRFSEVRALRLPLLPRSGLPPLLRWFSVCGGPRAL